MMSTAPTSATKTTGIAAPATAKAPPPPAVIKPVVAVRPVLAAYASTAPPVPINVFRPDLPYFCQLVLLWSSSFH